MARPLLKRSSDFPYHIVARSNNRDWFYIQISDFWVLFLEQCQKIHRRFEVRFHAFVLMSNHFHILLSTPNADIDCAMNYFMRELCRNVNRRANRINHLFGGPYRPSLIYSKNHYALVLKYIYRNPVKARISESVSSYPYSSFQFLKNESSLSFPIFKSSLDSAITDYAEFERFSVWLSRPTDVELECRISKGLRKALFRPRLSGLAAHLKNQLSA